VGVPAHQRWMNNGKFDGGQSTADEKALRAYYQTLLNLSHTASALSGDYMELDTLQRQLNTQGYDNEVFAFSRFNNDQQLIIVSNFSQQHSKKFTLTLPHTLINQWHVTKNTPVKDLLNHTQLTQQLELLSDSSATIDVQLAPLQSVVMALQR
jgi:glycosidase